MTCHCEALFVQQLAQALWMSIYSMIDGNFLHCRWFVSRQHVLIPFVHLIITWKKSQLDIDFRLGCWRPLVPGVAFPFPTGLFNLKKALRDMVSSSNISWSNYKSLRQGCFSNNKSVLFAVHRVHYSVICNQYINDGTNMRLNNSILNNRQRMRNANITVVHYRGIMLADDTILISLFLLTQQI